MKGMGMTELVRLLEFDFATAVDALDHHVGSRPERIALRYGETGEFFTYGEFGRLTDHIAAGLVARGIGEGDRVSVLTSNPIVAAFTMFGLWKAGAVFAPVNPQYEGDVLAYQLDDTAPALLVVDEELRGRVADIAPRLSVDLAVLTADGLYGGDFAELLVPADRPDRTVEFDTPACVIYTSGTTGLPKGVLQSHRWITHFLWIGRQVLTPDDVLCGDLPMYHVGGAHFNVTRAIWVGACVVLWKRFSASGFWDRIRRYECTTAQLLDVMIPWLLKNDPTPEDRDNTLNKVHMQPLPATHRVFAERFGVDFVTIAFGQSETGASVMGLIVENPPGQGTPPHLFRGRSHEELTRLYADNGLLVLDGRAEIPRGIVGKPGPFLDVAILDERDRECAPGTVGQIALRPKLPSLILREYLGKPTATLEAFRNLWFHTGDSGVRGEGGEIRYDGRLGDRIRVRGENIAGAQIEELIGRHPDVLLAAVVAVPGREGDEDDVVAFVQMVEGQPFDEAALSRHCADVMPRYMRPRRIIALDEFPRTATNKIEKYKLRALVTDGAPRPGDAAGAAARTGRGAP
jgi:crotonobetaine/carnitine-CoA ligase